MKYQLKTSVCTSTHLWLIIHTYVRMYTRARTRVCVCLGNLRIRNFSKLFCIERVKYKRIFLCWPKYFYVMT